MKFVLLTFDLEEFDMLKDYNKNIEKSEMFELSFEGLKRVITILDECEITATFFTTTVFGEKYPEMLKLLERKNHEIALHGYEHHHEYQKMNKKVVCSLLKKAKINLEKITKQKIIGYRSPRMAVIDNKILEKIGIKYDSSINPTLIPGKYNNFNEPRHLFKENNVIEIPTSVTPIVRLPFSFVFFRIFGLSYAKFCTRLTFLDSKFINVYFHPWEFVNVKKYHLPIVFSKNTGEKMSILFKKYINWCILNNFKIGTIKNFLIKNNFLEKE